MISGLKDFYRLDEKKKFKILIFFLFFLWFVFAINLSVKNIGSLCDIFRNFYGKTETVRLKFAAPDIFPTIEICRRFIPEDARVIFGSFPFRDFPRIPYYLYPRSVDPLTRDKGLTKFLGDRKIDYFIEYDNKKNPVVISRNRKE